MNDAATVKHQTRRSTLFIFLVTVWALLFVAWIGIVAVEYQSVGGTNNCEILDSADGTLHWSWEGLQSWCSATYQVDGYEQTFEEPVRLGRWGVPFVFALWGLSLYLLRPRTDGRIAT